MRSVLNRVFRQQLGIGKFLFSGVAYVVGYTLILVALQGYSTIRKYLYPAQSASSYHIINKSVGLGHTLFGGTAHFTEEEFKEIVDQPFVEAAATFRSNKFAAIGHVGNLGISTELFFESVPDEFIDRPAEFEWNVGEQFIPLIIPEDFLRLYNFGYAASRGTPQLSRSTIQMVPLKIRIHGASGEMFLSAKVVGFSDRIPSVLVPDNFLAWANREVGGVTAETTSRVIVKVQADETWRLEAFLGEKGWEINRERLMFGQTLGALNLLLSVVIAIGLAFVVFALAIVLMNVSLMIARARDEVSLLLQLGYRSADLVRHFMGYLTLFLATVSLVTCATFYLAKIQVDQFLDKNGIDVSGPVTLWVIMAAVLCFLLAMVVSFVSVRRLIHR